MAFAELIDGVIVVSADWSEKDLVKQVPGALWSQPHRAWTVPPSWATYCQLQGLLTGRIVFGPRVTDFISAEYERRIKPALAWRSQVECPVQLPIDERLLTFQRSDVRFMAAAGDAVLLTNDMGTGKTVSADACLGLLAQYGQDVLPALAIVPNSAKLHWRRHVLEWLPDAVPYVVTGGVQGRRKVLEQARLDPRAFVIVNIEVVYLHSRLAPYGSVRLKRCTECDKPHGDPDLKPNRCEVHRKEFNGFGFKTVLLDEAHRIANPAAKSTRGVWATMHDPSVTRRWAMTGTPCTGNPDSTWSILHAISPLEWPMKSAYVDRYCLVSWSASGVLDVVGLRPDTRAEYFAILDPRMRRMPKELVLPYLPKKVRERRDVDMTPKQAKAYGEIEDGLLTRLEDGQLLVARNNLTAATRLMQLASSYATITKPDPDDARTWQVDLIEPSPKLDAMEECLDELGDRPTLICAEHRKLIELARDRMVKRNEKFSVIVGGMSDWDRERARLDFQEGRVRALLFTIKAGGQSLDMSTADAQIFLQRSWSMIDNKQSEDRAHRIGNVSQSLLLIDIITRDTIEERQLERLLEKFERLEEILRDRETLRNAGYDTTELDQREAMLLDSWVTDDQYTYAPMGR